MTLHPLQSIPAGNARRLVLAGLIVLLKLLGERAGGVPPLEPRIVSLELAYSEASAASVIAAWGSTGVRNAVTAIWWDFALIPVYATLAALLCLSAAEALARRGMTSPGLRAELALVSAMFVAGLLDVTENLALLRLLRNGIHSPWTELAAICAGAKFILLIAGLGFLFWTVLAVVLVRPRAGA